MTKSPTTRYRILDAGGVTRYTRAGGEAEIKEQFPDIEIVSIAPLSPSSKKGDTSYRCLRINAPDWFARDDFRLWLAGRLPSPHAEPGTDPPAFSARPATWHEDGSPPTEYSDTFVTVDLGDGADEGSNSDMPPEVWCELCEICQAAGFARGLVWIVNITD